MMNKKLQAQIKKYAKQDIELVFRHGEVTVTDTKLGNITLSLNQDGKTIQVQPSLSPGRVVCYNALTGSGPVIFQEKLTKKEAISYLTEAFDVVMVNV